VFQAVNKIALKKKICISLLIFSMGCLVFGMLKMANASDPVIRDFNSTLDIQTVGALSQVSVREW